MSMGRVCMRRLFLGFSILCFLAAGVLAWLPYQMYKAQDLVQIRPFRSYLLAGNQAISDVTSDRSGRLYVTVQKKAVYVLNQNETIQHVIRIADGPLNRINDIDGVTGDSHGNVYVLVTTLDSQGLYVLYESINAYSADGQLIRTVFRRTPPSPMYREGDIRSMRVIGKHLWFDYVSPHAVQLTELNLQTDQSQIKATYQLPTTLQVGNASTAGGVESPTFVTTMTGDVYEVGTGLMRHLYVQPPTGGMATDLPRASLNGQSVYVFDAYHDRLVNISATSGTIRTVWNEASALQATGNQVDLADFQGLTVFGQTLVGVTSDHLWTATLNGTIVKVTDRLSVSNALLQARAMFITGLVFMLACILYWLGLLAWYVIERRRPLLLISFLIFVPAFIVAMALLNVVVGRVVTATDKSGMVNELHLLAHQGELMMDGDMLQALRGPASVNGKPYQSLLTTLDTIYHIHGAGTPFYNTLYQYHDGGLYIVHDDDSKVQPFTYFPISWNPVQDKAVLFHGQIITEPNPDASPQGYWMYALAPVYNGKHQIVGIYETGMDENVIVNQDHALFMKIAKPLALIFLAIFLLFILTNLWLAGLIRRLRVGAMAIANGKWGAVVNIKSKNEVQDLADSFNVMSRRLKETFEQVRGLGQIYYKFVPDKFIQFIGRETISEVQLGDQAEREMSILVCNIRDFYQLSKEHTAKDVFDIINHFLGDAGPIIGDKGIDGFVSKYLGSGILALFPEGPDTALAAGLRILDKLRSHRQISVGVGLHYGSVMLGVLGDATRWEGSVLSENVNLAQMVEESTGPLGASMLVTDDMLSRVQRLQGVQYRSLGRIFYAPLGRAVNLYDMLDADDAETRRLKLATKAVFEEGVTFFQEGKFHLAREAFVRVIQQNSADEAARLYFYAADEWRYKGVGHDWSGALTLVDLASNL